MNTIHDQLDALSGVETLFFKPAAVAVLQPRDESEPCIGMGQLTHSAVGDRIAIAVCNGDRVFAALLTPSEIEAFAHRLLRAAAVAQSEGTA